MNRSVFVLYLALIGLAPLLFGMVHDLVQAVFCFAFLALVVVWSVGRMAGGAGVEVGVERIWPEVAGFALVLVWAGVQLSPLGPPDWEHPLWAEAGAVLGAELAGGIGLARGDGLNSLMRLAMYAGVFWLALQWGRDRRRAGRMVGLLAVVGTLYALYGLVIHFGGFGTVLWVEKRSYVQDLTSVFINRNSFAAYAGLGLLCAGGLYLDLLLKALDSGRQGRDKVYHVLQEACVRGAPLLGCVLVLLTALFLSHSRAGISASLIALIVLMAGMAARHRIRGRLGMALALGVPVAAVLVFVLSGEGWLERLTFAGRDGEWRLTVYEQTLQAAALAPWTGYGLGAFERTFPLFADARTINASMAHNDWLEMLFELGRPAALVWFLALAGLTLRCLMGFFRRQRDNLYPLLGFCAALLLGLHCLADFSLQIPAIAVTFAALLGMGVAQGWSSRESAG